MTVEIINGSGTRIPRQFLGDWVARLTRALNGRVSARKFEGKELGLVFVKPNAARKLNKTYRGKNYATDVLSFEGDGDYGLGELVLCPELLKRQAKEHGLTYRIELGYMVIHGVLHLLGFDHERGGAQARRMFALQDRIFEALCRQTEAATSKRRRASNVTRARRRR